MNYAQKALGRALNALKAATQLRKAAEAVCQENPVSVMFAAASGRTVTLTLRPENRPDFHTAADEVATQAHARQNEAAAEVTRWAREVVLLADKEAEKLARDEQAHTLPAA